MHAIDMLTIDHARPVSAGEWTRASRAGSLTLVRRAALAGVVVATVGCGSVRGTDRPLLETSPTKAASETAAPASSAPTQTPTNASAHNATSE
ncbi:MAG: hypothetical protein DWH97_11355 [Planctomycetota bacterium]|nr:MAG: hypothetical protein DWH97_11355 [Planctomycetota bacterium]